MINIQNLASKGSAEVRGSIVVKYKDNICAELCLELWFESSNICEILPSQDGIESDCPETKFQTITF